MIFLYYFLKVLVFFMSTSCFVWKKMENSLPIYLYIFSFYFFGFKTIRAWCIGIKTSAPNCDIEIVYVIIHYVGASAVFFATPVHRLKDLHCPRGLVTRKTRNAIAHANQRRKMRRKPFCSAHSRTHSRVHETTLNMLETGSRHRYPKERTRWRVKIR